VRLGRGELSEAVDVAQRRASSALSIDASGRIVALHNAWNAGTGVRYAVSWEALRAFASDIAS
jgi:hypothetical protein